MDAVELLRSRNRHHITLPSGLNVTLRLPRLRDCILAGDVPLPVLEHVVSLAQSGSNNGQVLSAEESRHIARFQDEVVRSAVVQIEDQDVEMTLEAVAELEQADYDEIVALATRAKAVPKVVSPT